jgi:hypothetical protein
MVDSFRLARALKICSICLFAVYIFVVASDNFPYRALDPVWIINAGVTLIDNSYYPLIGLVLLHLAVYHRPDHAPTQALLRRSRRLAGAASLGFALLIPLLFLASWRSEVVLLKPRFLRIEYTRSRLDQLRANVAEVKSVAELESLLKASQRIQLSPQDQRRPLEILRTELLRRLDEARQQLPDTRRQRADFRWSALLRWIRLSLIALVYAIAFAALSMRRKTEQSQLEGITDTCRGMWVSLGESIAQNREKTVARMAFREEIRNNLEWQQRRIEQDALDGLLISTHAEEDSAPAQVDPTGNADEAAPERPARKAPFPDFDYFQALSNESPDGERDQGHPPSS